MGLAGRVFEITGFVAIAGGTWERKGERKDEGLHETSGSATL